MGNPLGSGVHFGSFGWDTKVQVIADGEGIETMLALRQVAHALHHCTRSRTSCGTVPARQLAAPSHRRGARYGGTARQQAKRALSQLGAVSKRTELMGISFEASM
jgi:hypothetical protein